MRIISKTKDRDYYDASMAFGQDQTSVFIRSNEVLDQKLLDTGVKQLLTPVLRFPETNDGNRTIFFNVMTVVFCGKTYKAISADVFTDYYALGRHEFKAFYSYQDFIDWVSPFASFSSSKHAWWKRNLPEIQAVFQNQGSLELFDFCHRNRYSILTSTCMQYAKYSLNREIEIIANGDIGKLQFYKVFDPFSAYQELDMFVSGVLASSAAATVSISDKDRIAQYGFDKMSFRKEPTKKKR